MTIEVVTLGCRLNAYESQIIRARAEEAGLQDAVIVNTCAVTGEAVRQSRQAIRKLRREHPGAKLIVTGCAAQIEPGDFAAMPEVDLVLGNQEKLGAENYHANFTAGAARVLVNDIAAVRETAPQFISGSGPNTRAILQVQNGCDHRCTFCIIPYGRGPSRSAGIGAIVDEARRLCAAGYREIVLSGVDLTDYGVGLPGRPGLGHLIQRVLRYVPQLSRLRLSSIDPAEVDELTLKLLGDEERLMPHFHLSVQSGDNLILKRMKRRHAREQVIGFCERARQLRPDVAFGADLIAGFPTEAEDMFENTLALAEQADLSYLHVFPFSPRSGTPAAKMPQLSRAVIKERARRLREMGSMLLARRLDRLVGTRQELLVEEPHSARTRCFAPVILDEPAEPGALLYARVESSDGRFLHARVLESAQPLEPQAVA